GRHGAPHDGTSSAGGNAAIDTGDDATCARGSPSPRPPSCMLLAVHGDDLTQWPPGNPGRGMAVADAQQGVDLALITEELGQCGSRGRDLERLGEEGGAESACGGAQQHVLKRYPGLHVVPVAAPTREQRDRKSTRL